MHIAFRADASVEIGTGHVMRCLTLADGLAPKFLDAVLGRAVTRDVEAATPVRPDLIDHMVEQ